MKHIQSHSLHYSTCELMISFKHVLMYLNIYIQVLF